MKHMAGCKRHSAEDIVRKLRRADELAAGRIRIGKGCSVGVAKDAPIDVKC